MQKHDKGKTGCYVEKLLKNNKVAGAGNWEEFREPLNDAENYTSNNMQSLTGLSDLFVMSKQNYKRRGDKNGRTRANNKSDKKN